uniref:Transmembrane protein 183 n=2 Tax=Timema TaxID=61471 RepID=A0A7R9G0S1_TIMSH|nr:unnamed protein product [Timema shepardi]
MGKKRATLVWECWQDECGSSEEARRKSMSMKRKDITLNDFANSRYSTGKTRIKKAATNNVVREAVVMKKAPRRRKKTISEDQSINIGGIDYPLDIWFLISEHIRPEDVSVFAGICKSALHVTNTAKFWFHLYKRYYRSVPNLPERLQPECMVRLYGLRTCVIRALHFMYPPFVNKVKAITTFEEDPHVLTKRQCVLMWSKKCKNQWLFFFKLKQSRFVIGRGPAIKAKQPDLLEMLEDVSSNHDEGCKVLQVTCLNYISIPVVLGLTLCSVSLTLSQGLRFHRLQLLFGSEHSCYTLGSSSSLGGSPVVLDPVVNVRVLDWWHPLYPHSASTGFNIPAHDSD